MVDGGVEKEMVGPLKGTTYAARRLQHSSHPRDAGDWWNLEFDFWNLYWLYYFREATLNGVNGKYGLPEKKTTYAARRLQHSSHPRDAGDWWNLIFGIYTGCIISAKLP
jgi:hypothetical protein